MKGRYIPLFASEIYDQNKKLADSGLATINLKSIMIGRYIYFFASTLLTMRHILSSGNGWTDSYRWECFSLIESRIQSLTCHRMVPSYYDMMCTGASVDPILDISYEYLHIYKKTT